MFAGDPSDPGIEVEEYAESEMIYTSGTTGRPKGAVLVHHNQIVLTTTVCSLFALNPADRILHVAPLFHSAELNLYLNPGTYMGCTHVIMKDFVPNQVLAMIQKEKITQFFGAPIMYLLMMKVPNFDEYDLSSVRFFGYGAAPMAAESVKQAINKFKTTNFFCLCGLTEGGPGGIALYPNDQIRKAGAAGKYIVNMETRLVDDQENTITKPGVVGELVIKGETTMKEYYKNPEATADTIRNGWVHSGDLGVMDEEGYITLVDRKKDMIITGGENVYSKEVEDALFEHPKISMAAGHRRAPPNLGRNGDGRRHFDPRTAAYFRGTEGVPEDSPGGLQDPTAHGDRRGPAGKCRRQSDEVPAPGAVQRPTGRAGHIAPVHLQTNETLG